MADVVHILHLGFALCGKPGSPSTWEPGHKWVGLLNDDHGPRSEATCDDCLRSVRYRDPVTGVIIDGPVYWPLSDPLQVPPLSPADNLLEKARRFAREWREEEGCSADLLDELQAAIEAYDGTTLPEQPMNAGLVEVFATHGEDILRSLFAWRGQGSITRWKTKISRRLAHLADRLQREYPQATAALHEAGNADAVEDVLSAAARRRTPKGFAAELTRLRDELGSLGQLVDELADYAHATAEDEPRAEDSNE